MGDIKIHFSDFFNIPPSALEEYGAFDIALISDMPVFIDPFRLYASDKKEYQDLHGNIIKYLCFLRDYCQANATLDAGMLHEYFYFPEVKNLYMGFSETGNRGRGLGSVFANVLYKCFTGKLRDFGNETVTQSSHLEKLCIIADGVGRDFVSDFSANLIKGYLLRFTEQFADKYLKPDQCEFRSVNRAYFDFDKRVWKDKEYCLPIFNGDFVLLAPRDMLTRDDTWISHRGLLRNFNRLPVTIGDDALRSKLSHLIDSICNPSRRINDKEKKLAYKTFLELHPEIADWYIKDQEDHKTDALVSLSERIADTESIFVSGTKMAATKLRSLGFYEQPLNSLEETRVKIGIFKNFIENNDGYRLFYDKNGNRLPEAHMQLAFRLLWYGSNKDVNREANNGRGPVDFKISFGNSDKCIIEFKWAANAKLKENLLFQPKIYAKANGTKHKFCVILYTSKQELNKVEKVLSDIGKVGDKDIILIDASKKVSASNVVADEFDFDDDNPTTLDNIALAREDITDNLNFDLQALNGGHDNENWF